MRDIKFRGKRIDNGEWVDGYYVFYSNIALHHIISSEDFVAYEVDPSTVGQFTGLTDKNGKDIYEGDLLKYKSAIVSGEAIVRFTGGHFFLDGYYLEEQSAMINETFFKEITEIIGTVHDKELTH